MTEYFKDKVALVTGSASPRGLGRAIVNRIAKEGTNIVILDLNPEAVQKAALEVKNTYNVKTLGVACNVTKEADCISAINQVKTEFGRLDFLVNNAGVLKDNLLMRITEADWDMVIDVNLKGVFLMTKSASKLILKSPTGRIVNISSVSGLVGQAAQANYSSSKAGVIALTKVFRKGIFRKGSNCKCNMPGIYSNRYDRCFA